MTQEEQKESALREIKSWVTFYKDGSISGKTEKDRSFNSGIVDGVKLTLDTLLKHKQISHEDIKKIF